MGVAGGAAGPAERAGAAGAAMSFCSFVGGEVFKDHFQPGEGLPEGLRGCGRGDPQRGGQGVSPGKAEPPG